MKNGSLEARKASKGCFGGSTKAKRTINYKKAVIKDKKIVGVKAAKKTVGKNYKGAAGSKMIKKYQRASALM